MSKKYYGIGSNDSTALFIGYIADKMKTEYEINSGATRLTDTRDIVNQLGGFNYQIEYNFNSNYIYNQLLNSDIVIARAEDKDSADSGHTFIIDRYKTLTIEGVSVFGWVGTDTNGNDTNEWDDEGNVIGYSFTTEKRYSSTSIWFGMNWGWAGFYDNTWYECSSNASWPVGEIKFDSKKYFLKK